MWIDDVTLANAINERFGSHADGYGKGRDPGVVRAGWIMSVCGFVADNKGGPMNRRKELAQAVVAEFGRPTGQEWMMADWARLVAAVADGVTTVERRGERLPEWSMSEVAATTRDYVNAPDRSGFFSGFMEFDEAFDRVRRTVEGSPAELEAMRSRLQDMSQVTPPPQREICCGNIGDECICDLTCECDCRQCTCDDETKQIMEDE